MQPIMPAATVVATTCLDYSTEAVAAAVGRLFELGGGLAGVLGVGGTVLVKPNLLSPRAPEEAVTTHPAVVEAVVRAVQAAGAARVWIGDSCAGDHADERLWEMTGMAAVAQATGAELKSFGGAVKPRRVGDSQVPVPVWLDEVSAILSLPKLKTHTLTGLTCAMKNSYGLVAGAAKSAYHASHPSPRTMSEFLVRVHMAMKPSFFVVDAVVAQEGEGPANGRPRSVGLLLGGCDGVAIDAVCSRLLVGGSRQVPMLKYARQLGAGMVVSEDIAVVGDGVGRLASVRLKPSLGRYLQRIPEPVFKLVTRVLACHPRIDDELCVKCGVCASICSQNAIVKLADGRYRVEAAHCIMCMCCAESCPRHAIPIKSPLDLFRRVRRLALRRSGDAGR